MALRVFITGASSGLGAALAARYAVENATLGLVGRSEERLLQLTERFKSPCMYYLADVGNASAVLSAAQDFIARYGLPDVVIANAGVSVGTDPSVSADLAVLERTLRTNLVGVANTFQPFIEAMREQRRGTLVGIASVAGLRGLPGSGAYSASKSALITWLESLRVELHGSGVAVVTICPGYVDTPMTRVNPYRMPFLLSPDEAARRVLHIIARRRRFAVVPWQMAVVARFLRALPRVVYDRLFARAPRKPRQLPL